MSTHRLSDCGQPDCPICAFLDKVRFDSSQDKKAEAAKIAAKAPSSYTKENVEHLRGAVRLWRIWAFDSVRMQLKALVANYFWKPGVNSASAPAPGGYYGFFDNEIASYDSGHGFYGFKSLEDLISQEGMNYANALKNDTSFVVGSILCLGKIKIHRYGAKVEYAIPEYFIVGGDIDEASTLRLSLADKYHANLVTEEQARVARTGLVPFDRSMLHEND